MHRNTRAFIIGTAFTSALWLAAPASAQHGREQRGRGNQGRQTQQAPARPQERVTAPPPPQVQQSVPPHRSGAAVPRATVQAPPAAERRVPQSRPAPQTAPAQRYDRGGQGSRYSVPPPATYRSAPYSSSHQYGHGYGYSYGYPVRRPVFVQPYYVYRPRFTFSFGIGFGYGVAYPWSYWNPYGAYNYGITVRPGYSPSAYYSYVGGVSFDLDPWDAAIYVDGHYVGIAGDFGPDQMPLTLAAGRHRLELRRDGFRTARFDVNVVAGQVIPYQGALQYD